MRQLGDILAKWQLTDPLLHRIASSHSFESNNHMSCPVRTGRGRVEYNEKILGRYPGSDIERLLKIEMLRIAMRHPYERRPDFCSGSLMTLASNLVICDNYPEFTDMLPAPSQYGLPVGKSYEWYVMHLYTKYKNEETNAAREDADAADEDASELWGEHGEGEPSEDFQMKAKRVWGNETGEENVSIKAKVADAKQLIARLRSLLSYSDCIERRFTRMRPNRRRDYEVMGMIRKSSPKILVAFDVSGSMHEEKLNKCLGAVGRIGKVFKTYADVLFFDNEIRSVVSVKTALSRIVAPGGGGTNYQPAVEYAIRNHYDALVYLTDGEATIPAIPKPFISRVLWCSPDGRKDFMKPESYFRI